MKHQIEIEIPYGCKLVIPLNGSEAVMKALLAGTLVERTWRDDEQVAYKSNMRLQANYVDYKVIDRPAPEPEPEPKPI